MDPSTCMRDLETVTNQLLQRKKSRKYAQLLNRRPKRTRRHVPETPSPIRLTGGMIVGFLLGLVTGQIMHFLYNVHKLSAKFNVSVYLIFQAIRNVIFQHFPDLTYRSPVSTEST